MNGPKRMRQWAALTAVLTFTLMSMVIPAGAGSASADTSACVVDHGVAAACASATDQLSAAAGGPHTYTMKVQASQTKNIQPRQNVTLNLTGFAPTRNYAFQGNSFAATDEYPVVILECWGTNDPKTGMDPTHCYGGGFVNIAGSLYRNTNDPQHPTPGQTLGISRLLGFTSVSGTFYTMGGFQNQPTDLQASTGFPPNNRIEWIGADGNRSNIKFELRSTEQYPSLGCSSTEQCSIVVVPILHPAFCAPTADANCTGPALNPPGSVVTPNVANQYLTAKMWWLPSNWANRMSIPFSFAPSPNECALSDSRQQVPMTGSELAYQAMFSWVPFFCLDPKRFNLGYVPLGEPRARSAFTQSGPGQLGAVLTSLPVTNSTRPIVHAPIAVSGFAVTFLIDDAHNQQVLSLNFTPLLLAKLITDSYRGFQATEPALQANPVDLFTDPEFLAVNPGLALPDPNANWLTELNMIMFGGGAQSDVVWALTSYINADPEARAWLDGAPDNYSGMVVNPNYRGYSLPQLNTEIRDQYEEPTGGLNPGCTLHDPTPNQNLLSQPVNTLKDAANFELSGLAQGSWNCDVTNVWKKIGTPQTVGSRALLALTSVPFAQLYGLPAANLQVHQLANGKRFFMGPMTGPTGQDPAPMVTALAFSNQDKTSGVLSLDYPHLATNAYPGTMPVYAAVPTAGLDSATAKDYAAWMTYAVTDGQATGTQLGQLPAGYAPLTGALSPLAAFTLQAARDVAAQNGQVPAPPPDLGGQIGGASGTSAFTGPAGPGSQAGVPTGAGSPSSGPSATSGARPGSTPKTVALTRGTGSWLAAWGLLVLLGVGALAGLSVPLVRMAGQPDHPMRQSLTRFRAMVMAAVSRRRT